MDTKTAGIIAVIVVVVIGGAAAILLWEPEPVDEEVEITIWHNETPAHRVDAIQQVLDGFNEENPDIHVEQEVIGWGDAWPRTVDAIAEGTEPELMMSLPDLDLTAYKHDGLLPVTDLVEELDDEYNINEDALNHTWIEGEHYSVPMWTMPMVLIYRPSLFEEHIGTTEPPETWSEWLEYAEAFEDVDGVYGVGMSAAVNLLTQEQAYLFMANTGALTFDEDGEVVFNSPETVEAFEMYEELFEYTPPGATEWGWGESEMSFPAGEVAMMPYFGALQRRFIEDLESRDMAAAPLPVPDYRDPDDWRTLGYTNTLAIFEAAERRGKLEEVKDLVRYMLRPDVNAILTAGQDAGAFIPVTHSAAEADEYWEHEHISEFPELNQVLIEASLEHGQLWGYEEEIGGRITNLGLGDVVGARVYAEVANAIATGDMTVEEAVEMGHDTIEDIVEE